MVYKQIQELNHVPCQRDHFSPSHLHIGQILSLLPHPSHSSTNLIWFPVYFLILTKFTDGLPVPKTNGQIFQSPSYWVLNLKLCSLPTWLSIYFSDFLLVSLAFHALFPLKVKTQASLLF